MITRIQSNKTSIKVFKQQNYNSYKSLNLNRINKDVFVQKNSQPSFKGLKGSDLEEARKIFKELIKHAPETKINSIKKIQETAEIVPHGGFVLGIANLAFKVYQGKYTEAGVQSLLQAADLTIFAPAKTTFITAYGIKGGTIGLSRGPIGAGIGATVGAGGALATWALIRNKIGTEIAKLIDDDNDNNNNNDNNDKYDDHYENWYLWF